MGAAASSSLRHSSAIWSHDGVGTTDCQTTTSDVRCIRVQDQTGATVHNADLTSFDSDGFTLNWTTANGTARVINYIALGGDITAWVGQISSKTTTGEQAYTGVGFLPTCLLLFKPHGTGSTPTGGGAVSAAPAIGWASGINDRGYLAGVEEDGAATSNSRRYARTGKCYGVINPTTPTSRLIEADFVSFDSDGFTLDWTTASVTARTIIAVALNGVSARAGSFEQRSGTGSQAVSGVGFPPKCVLFTGGNAIADETGTTDDLDLFFGAASGASAEGVMWAGSDDSADTSAADSAISTNSAIQARTPGTAALLAEADLTSLDSDGFTLNYSTADSVARLNLFLALGDALTAVSASLAGLHEAKGIASFGYDGPHEGLFGLQDPESGVHEARGIASFLQSGLHEALTKSGIDSIPFTALHEGKLGVSDEESGVHESTGNPGFLSISVDGVHEGLSKVMTTDAGVHEGLQPVSKSDAGVHEAGKVPFIPWKHPRRHTKFRPPQQLPGVADGG
jgi:hypothetical protein